MLIPVNYVVPPGGSPLIGSRRNSRLIGGKSVGLGFYGMVLIQNDFYYRQVRDC
jgi:hypothetical protein